MSTTRTLIATITLTVVLSAASIEAQPLDERHETPTTVHTVEVAGATVYFESARDVLDVIWGLDRFRTAGLELPHVHIRLEYRDRCAVAGSKWTDSDGLVWVKICARPSRLTLLHELGHVWDGHNLTEAGREELQELRGLDSWSHEIWELAAGEHLAETLTWALNAEHRLPLRIDNHSEYELNEMYRLATGTDAPILDGRTPQQPIQLDPDDEILDHGSDLGAGATMG